MVFADGTARSLRELTSLEGRGVIVTGAARGLGYAIAARAREAGATLLLVDRDESVLAAAAERLGCDYAVADLTDSEQASAVVDLASQLLPSLYGLVNNVGVFSPAADAAEMTDEQWHHIVQTDLSTAFYCSRSFAQRASPDTNASIVMNGSIESVRGRPRLAHYTAAKFGMVGLAQTLAIDFGKRNIRVNVIAPGLAVTESTSGSPIVSDPQQRAAWGTALPAGRMAVPDDIARVALFYLSDLSLFVTGTTLLVDGGERAG